MPVRPTVTVTRSDTTRQPPSVSGSSSARSSASGQGPSSAYEGSGSAPSQPQNTAPPAVTRTRSEDRANRTSPPPGSGSAPCTAPGTRASSVPRRGSAAASERRRRHAERSDRSPCAVQSTLTDRTSFSDRTRSRASILISLPLPTPGRDMVQLPFTCGPRT
ncbi:hypothetical protein LJB45_39280 [Streptomyces rapamycinicus]|nr:hypothetical protein LJB45_39280 [Streptomyces rapamycinicus]